MEPIFEPCCLTTTVGSLPHTDVARGTALIFEHTPQIPAWVQLPRRTVEENMVHQFTEGMAGLAEDGGRVYFDRTLPDFDEQLTDFYARYLAVTEEQDDTALETFAISPACAAGFPEFLAQLPAHIEPVVALKGQITGPFTLGTTLTDQDRRFAYYDDSLRDMVVKTTVLKARWQIKHLAAYGRPVMIFIDEPSLLSFGSSVFITISEEDVLRDLKEVTDEIHSWGALAGVHCEEDTDWSLLMRSELDILDFDAYDHMRGITLYPRELAAFLERGGSLGWGIVPTLDREAAASETVESLRQRFERGLDTLARKGFDRDLLLRRALITPSCGAGGVLTEELAERVLSMLQELAAILRGEFTSG
jgi:methionine synthase II (cobalamin-independent)